MFGKIIVNVKVTSMIPDCELGGGGERTCRNQEEEESFAVPVNFTLEDRLAMIHDASLWNEEKAHLQKKAIGQAIKYLLELKEWLCSCCQKRPAIYMSGSPMLRLDKDTGMMGWDTFETPHCAQPECIMEIRRRYRIYIKETQKEIGKDIPWTQMCANCKRIDVIMDNHHHHHQRTNTTICTPAGADLASSIGSNEQQHQGGQQRGLLRCGGCRMVWYCNKDCQKEHWKNGHKEECMAVVQSRKNQVAKSKSRGKKQIKEEV